MMLATISSLTGVIFSLFGRGIERRSSLARVICFMVLSWCAGLSSAYGLEKYGRPLPSMEKQGEEAREAEETLFGGYLLAAPFVSNPTFAARPDNTGLVGMRYMAHFEVDLYKQYLTFYTDQNFFSDRTNGWIILSEWDMAYALTGLIDRWGWRIQFERDAPLDKSGLKQMYADVLGTGNLHAAEDFSWWRKYFPHQNLNAYAGFGWLFHNSNYFARPDNTGRALFRYVAHADFDLYKNTFVLYGDMNFFTDRELNNKLRPTELDWIVGLAFRFKDNYEISVYREQDLSLDKPGTLIQEYWAVQLRFAFDVPKRMFARTQ